MNKIHPTAIIADGAQIGNNVLIGPYCVIGNKVILDDGVELISHVCIDGSTTINKNTKIYPFATIGQPTPDLKYKGEDSAVHIGENCSIREYVTIHPGTAADIMKTIVGNNCLLMVGVHIAHDCILGENVIMANLATLGGHVKVGNFVNIGGLSAVQQRVRIGDHAIIGGMSGVEKDVIPYAMVIGERAHLHGLNIIGLRRRGFSNQVIQQLMKFYDTLFNDDDTTTFQDRIKFLEENDNKEPAIQLLKDFVNQETHRHYCTPKNT